MASFIQTTVDSADALTQADWWAETLGWIVEPTDEAFVRSMIEQGYATDGDTVTHEGKLVWRGAAAITPADRIEERDRPRMLFQDVPEKKSGKNRVHWDVRTGEDIDQVRSRLEARGAAYVATHSQGPMSWHVMTDPEGNEFCIS